MALAAFTGLKPQAFRQQQEGVENLVDAICTAGVAGIDAVVVVDHSTTLPKATKEGGRKRQ
jgi:hypothetical protein